MTMAAKMPSVATKHMATHTAKRAACGRPPPNSLETLMLQKYKEIISFKKNKPIKIGQITTLTLEFNKLNQKIY